jgi:hypothetical protein
MVEVEKDKPLWAAFLKENESENVFVITKKGNVFEGNWFHGKGFWTKKDWLESDLEDFENKAVYEIWLHGSNISYIRSLMYKER